MWFSICFVRENRGDMMKTNGDMFSFLKQKDCIMINNDLGGGSFGKAALPLRWLRQIPLCRTYRLKIFREPIPFSKLRLYNRASDKSIFCSMA